MLSSTDWERRLTFHYLHSDGPSGGGALSFVDATPTELAAASGLDPSEARTQFLAQFSRWDVQWWLDGRRNPSPSAGPVPGFFRYLVLTAFVVAMQEEDAASNDFRERLGRLLGIDRLHSTSGVNDLWRSLRNWADARRNAGEPIRQILLPCPGNETLIGIANRIAFPSWRDRLALTAILQQLPERVVGDPDLLIAELSRASVAWRLPDAVAAALEDFCGQLRAGRRMLKHHRFWLLVRSIDASLRNGSRTGGRQRWSLEASFSGWQDEFLELGLCIEVDGDREEGRWHGSPAEILSGILVALPNVLRQRVEAGFLAFRQGPRGGWVADEDWPGEGDMAIGLASAAVSSLLASMRIGMRPVGDGWHVTDLLEPEQLRSLMSRLGLTLPRNKICDLVIDGGIRLSRSSWLGRKGYLPTIEASKASLVSLQALDKTAESVVLVGRSPLWALAADKPLSGRWRVAANEGRNEISRLLVFERCAPERIEWPKAPHRLLPADPEIEAKAGGLAFIGEPSKSKAAAICPEAIDDLMEAIYAGASSTDWPEGRLVELIGVGLPAGMSRWDVLRAFVETGWLETHRVAGWGANVHRLRPPSLTRRGDGTTRLEGAIGAAARVRLAEVLRRRGSSLRIVAGLSRWSPPSLIVDDGDPAGLAHAMGWALTELDATAISAAPDCWRRDKRTPDGRKLAGIWCFDRGRYVPPDAPDAPAIGAVALRRWRREHRDDHDLHEVCWPGGVFRTSVRSAAVMEAARLARRPVFRWVDGCLLRTGSSGHLPLSIARDLWRRFPDGCGPVEATSDRWSYAYTADRRTARMLAAIFGAAVEVPTEQETPVRRIRAVARARRIGARPTWLGKSGDKTA